ncbi:MAG TPA: sterol desaturase family protein [Steroidobacteraceae bacterium]|nr:sterol desaturase family protein [Steroidobacteraceae bacterium]
MDKLSTILQFFGVAVLAMAVMEALALKFIAKRGYDWRASLATLGVLVGRILTEGIPIALAMPGAFWLYAHRGFEPEQYGAWSYLILFFGLEFVYYWWHRTSHRSRWFWVNHAVHHSPNELNLSAAIRVGWTARLMATYVLFLPLVWIGFSPQVVFAAYGLNLAYQFWIHTEWIPRLGWLEGILNTPAAHRVHHASNLEYLDSNYGGVLVIFDRLFGTYRVELDSISIRYGLVTPLHSYHPIKIALHQCLPLLRDVWTARSPREVMGYVFGPPGWKPDGSGMTTENLRRAATLPRANLDQADLDQTSLDQEAALKT